ncbi:MAG TPA: hypothetical protein VEH53_09120 [archaeon]|nr:hypothetical protein [archaeon]
MRLKAFRLRGQAPKNAVALRFLKISDKRGHVEEGQRHTGQASRRIPADPEIKRPAAAFLVGQDASAVEQEARLRGGTRDPLASPTLARIYASQGHTEVAEGIYSQIERGGSVTRPTPSSRATSEEMLRVRRILEKLLALREAARRVKVAVDRATGPNETYGH